jgi:hypothetical protein
MSDAEYHAFLSEVEAKLPVWEAALKRVDPARVNMSYADGREVIGYRDLALKELGWTRTWIQKEHIHRQVSQELELIEFMDGLYTAIENLLLRGQNVDVHLETFAPVMSDFIARGKSDLSPRVKLLEKQTCP